MSILLDQGGADQYFTIPRGILKVYPMTMAAWFYPVTTGAQDILTISDLSVADAGFRFKLQSGPGPVQAEVREGGGTPNANSTANWVQNEWNHGCGVFTSSTLRAAYLNGGSKGTNTSSRTPDASVLDTTSIGTYLSTSAFGLFDGRLAEVCLWNVALVDAEVSEVYKNGPLGVRRDRLVGYWLPHQQAAGLAINHAAI